MRVDFVLDDRQLPKPRDERSGMDKAVEDMLIGIT